MKTTYLIFKQVDGTRQLVVATQEEWDAILKDNKRLPENKRRKFMMDCIEDGNELDCMYIEVSTSEHRSWNSKHTVSQRNRKEGSRYTRLSLDAPIRDTDAESLHECVPCEFDLERIATDKVLLEELQSALRAWKPWALELLTLYLEGKGRSCTNELCEKYGLKERAVRYRKGQFEEFVKNFLK